MANHTKGRRGFALLDAAQRQAMARKGGQSAHAKGRAHQWTREEAREAGRKGGLASGSKMSAPEAAQS